MEITTVGLAEHLFQVHGIGAAGRVVVVRKALRRAQVLAFFGKLQPCLVGMEACGTSHHRARDLLVEQRTRPVNMMRGLPTREPVRLVTVSMAN